MYSIKYSLFGITEPGKTLWPLTKSLIYLKMINNRNILFVFSFLLFILPGAKAQSIVHSDYDGFTGNRNIETSIVSLKSGFSTGFGIAFRVERKNYYMSLIGYGKKNRSVAEEDRLQFILKDGSIIKFDSRVQLPSNESSVPNLYIHHYYISKNEVDALKKNPVSIVRVVSPSAHVDFAVSKKNSGELIKVSKLFIDEINKY